MRGMLIANPNASSTTTRTRKVIVQALSHLIDLRVEETQWPGHAGELAARAHAEGLDVLVVLGGDGTVHECVNGMLGPTLDRTSPALAVVPGGSANVLARALGLPNDPVEATGAIIEALIAGRRRRIGLGKVNGRYFTCNVGLGFDAEIIEEMERMRAEGKAATPTRYLMTAIRHYFVGTDRRNPALTVLPHDGPPVEHAFMAIIQNTSPWTYLGGLPINACTDADFATGLDIWAIRRMGVVQSLRWAGRLLRSSDAGSTKHGLFTQHDLPSFAVVAARPVPLQVDGEALDHVEHATFESIPNALEIIV